MKPSVSSVRVVRTVRKRNAISPDIDVRHGKFSAAEMEDDADDYDGSVPAEIFRKTDAQKAAVRRSEYVLCIAVGGHEGKINVGKVYRVAKPAKSDGARWLRIVNEEDKVARYRIVWFVPVNLPAAAKEALKSYTTA